MNERIAALQTLYGTINRVPVTKGTKLYTEDGKNDRIKETPAELALQAGATEDQYSIARALATEGWNGPESDRSAAAVAKAWTIINEVARRNELNSEEAIATPGLITKVIAHRPGRRYGSQRLGGYVSTWNDPTAWEIIVANEVLQGLIPDTTNGATQFVSPRAWKQLEKKPNPNHTVDQFADVMRRWHKSVAMVNVEGIDPYYLLFFRREPDAEKRKESLKKVLAIYLRGPSRAKASGTEFL